MTFDAVEEGMKFDVGNRVGEIALVVPGIIDVQVIIDCYVNLTQSIVVTVIGDFKWEFPFSQIKEEGPNV